ncbi:MAG: NAD-dependent deacylase [Peptococcaceae bacterium]|nr:NAD-dependent deacylase [Peptococcaceae bacterium]
MKPYAEKISALAGLIKNNSPCFVLSGAGISTESGIPDFRSPGTGLWTKIDPVKAASLTALQRDPAAFYDTNLARWRNMAGIQPNDAHRAVAALEREGLITGVITQNVDSLHTRAGSRRVWEVHGHLRTCRCMACGDHYPMEELFSRYDRGENPPRCAGCGGILRPDVVLFEDPMSDDFYRAEKALTGCQLMIVAGSSLQVYPVAGLPRLARRLAIVNRDPTPWDDRADVVINESTGKVFRDLLAEMAISF